MNPLLATADPISQVCDTPVKTYLRKSRKMPDGQWRKGKKKHHHSEKQQKEYQGQGRRRKRTCSMVEQIFSAACMGTMMEQRKSVRRKEQQRGTAMY